MRALVFMPTNGGVPQVLWYINTSLSTAEIHFATHEPTESGLWLWENNEFRRLTINELRTFAETGVPRKRCHAVYVPRVLRPFGSVAPTKRTRCCLDLDHEGDHDFNGYKQSRNADPIFDESEP
jgi:hypothetical protein